MRPRLWYGLTAFALASVLNPGYFVGCASSSEDDSKFQYGAKEMTEFALAANDSYEFEVDAEQYRADVDIEPVRAGSGRAAAETGRGRSLFAVTAHACGDRKLFATASACIDSSSIDVQGKFTLLRIRNGAAEVVASDVSVHGSLKVDSPVLSIGSLDLEFDGGHLGLSGTYGDSFKVTTSQLQGLVAAKP